MRRIFLFSMFVALFPSAWGGRANAQDYLAGAQGTCRDTSPLYTRRAKLFLRHHDGR